MVSVEMVPVLVLGGVPGSDVDNRHGAVEWGASVNGAWNGEILTTHGVIDCTSQLSRGWKTWHTAGIVDI